jgi:hypothetical protein
MSKRRRFVITVLLLSLGFFGMQFLNNQFRFLAIGTLSALTTILFVWSLKEGLGKNTTLLALILPTFFTLGVGLFWFLLPASVFARVPIVIFYGIGIYAICLTTNIYTVSAIRTIALLRAARGVGFVLSLLTSFLLYDTILSLKMPIWINALLVYASSWPIFLQGFWSINLEEKLTSDNLITTSLFSFVIAEVSISLFFWPVTVIVGSLFLTVAMYILLGLGQSKFEGRLFATTVREYLTVGLLVMAGMLIATHWGA